MIDRPRINRPTLSIAVLSSALAFSFMLSGCGREDSDATDRSNLTPVVLQTNWAPQPEDGGFFHAEQSGLYASEGVDVSVRPASAGMNIYAYVAAGEAEFGITVISKLLVAIDKGLPLVAVAAYRPTSLRVLLLHENDPAQNLADLNGRVLKARGEDLWLKYLKSKYSLNLKVIPHDFGLGQFLADQELVQQGLLTSEPFTLRERGVPIRILALEEAGWENLEVLFCHRALLLEQPELVAKVVKASLQGWRDFLEGDATATLQWLAKENPARSLESMSWARDALATMYAQSGVLEGEAFGKIDPAKIEQMTQILLDLEAIDQSIPVEKVFDAGVFESL